MSATTISLLAIVGFLAVTGWLAAWMAQDQTKGVMAQLRTEWADNDRLRAENEALRRAAFLLPGDTPIGDEAARHLTLVRGDGA